MWDIWKDHQLGGHMECAERCDKGLCPIQAIVALVRVKLTGHIRRVRIEIPHTDPELDGAQLRRCEYLPDRISIGAGRQVARERLAIAANTM